MNPGKEANQGCRAESRARRRDVTAGEGQGCLLGERKVFPNRGAGAMELYEQDKVSFDSISYYS